MSEWLTWIIVIAIILLVMYVIANFTIVRNKSRSSSRKKKQHDDSSSESTTSESTTSESTTSESTTSESTTSESITSESTVSCDELSSDEKKMLLDSGLLDVVNSNTDLTPSIPSIVSDSDYRPDGFYKGGFVSKGEAECKAAAERIYGIPFHTVRPYWLGGLEIDCYAEVDGVKIGIEYNGEQHYKYIPRFHHNGPSDLAAQIVRDHRKMDLCEQNGVHLIIVPYNIKVDRIESYIKYSNPLAVEQRQRLAKLQ